MELGEIRYQEKKRWAFLGLPWTTTTYVLRDDVITVTEGLLSRKENDCYMYKVQDVQLVQSLFERWFKMGTVRCLTGDTTSPELDLVHVRNAREIKNFILDASEKARLRRRTVNMVDIGADSIVGDID